MTTEPWTYPGYEKIADTPDRWRLDERGWRTLGRAQWVVTEKIHGANFCLATDGETVRAANRRQWLADGDAFFGWQAIAAELAPAVRALLVPNDGERRDVRCVYVYGELFGGSYPHPDVAPAVGIRAVQTGVWYAPDVRFVAFDLREEATWGTSGYLDYADAVRAFDSVGIPYAQPLLIGSYAAASEYPVRFDSTLPRTLGLPDLTAGANLAEGIVIKPWREVAGLCDASGDPVRPVLKRKIAEFAEDRRFHQAKPWLTPVAGGAFDLLKWECYNRMTPARLAAAVSKVGPAASDETDAERDAVVLALVRDDVIDEAHEAMPDSWASLTPSERRALEAYAADEALALLVAEYDGDNGT